MIDDLSLRVIQTYVGRPAPIGATRNGDVISAIRKAPVDAATLELGAINLAGDDQADRSVHGGPDKSVYCYPSEHTVAWQADGFDLPPGSVGENVSLAGATEADVRIGDTFRWGTSTIQISQPRAPCFKLTMHTGRKDVGPHLIETRRSGWYVRTLAPGTVETRGRLVLLDRDETAPTVAETFAIMFHGVHPEADDPEVVTRVVGCAALAPEWLDYLRARNPLAR
ncbi:MAG: MOSC domain-containing protein [Acidimicrobiia bacterium]